jgi:hypothetical protein
MFLLFFPLRFEVITAFTDSKNGDKGQGQHRKQDKKERKKKKKKKKKTKKTKKAKKNIVTLVSASFVFALPFKPSF